MSIIEVHFSFKIPISYCTIFESTNKGRKDILIGWFSMYNSV